MRDCKEYRTLINEYVDGEINSKDEIRLFDHLSKCNLCQKYFYEIKNLKRCVRSLNFPYPDEGLDYVILSKTHFRRIHPISSTFKNLRFRLLNGFIFNNLRDMFVGFPLALFIFLVVFSLFSSVPQTFESVIKEKYTVVDRQEEINKMIYNVLYMESVYQFTPESLSLNDVYIPRISSIPLKNIAEKYIKDSNLDDVELIATITKDGNARVEKILEVKNKKLERDLMRTLDLSLVLPAISNGKKVNARIAIKFDKVVVTG